MAKPTTDLTPKARRTRASLLDAARIAIGKQGMSGVTVMEVCEIADVGRTSFYNYFNDADKLIEAVVEEAAQSLKHRFDTLHEGVPRGLLRLEHCLEMILMLAVDDQDTALLLTSLSQSSGPKLDLLFHEIEQELKGARQSGDLSLSNEQCVSLTHFIAISTIALCREIALGRLGQDQISHQVANLLNACRSN